ncbi:MAG: peptide-methionine (S)-S-oxide reductase MsrA [Dehalococcoidales bacterium]|nr:peptide-methionine (S)-S-oxide reductase MsrA [Dehalococcoidales bacterium]
MRKDNILNKRQSQTNSISNKEIATLAGGCFWCLEAIFNRIEGIDKITSGYSGGTTINPSYEEVCAGTTGHAEVVQLIFNPQIISFQQILNVFFSTHDPTTVNRQGNDIGTQYRSIIFYHSEEQKTIAEMVIQELNGKNLWHIPIVTEVIPFKEFYPAENYHHDYFNNNSQQPYCRVVIAPKLAKFHKQKLSGIKFK